MLLAGRNWSAKAENSIAPLAVAIIGGTITSTYLTLLIVLGLAIAIGPEPSKKIYWAGIQITAMFNL